MRSTLTCIVISVLLLGPAASAAPARLELDSLSFFYFEGAEVGNGLPAASIPIDVEATGPDQWSIRVRSTAFSFPDVTYPSGSRVRWELTGDATGMISGRGSELVVTLHAPALAFVGSDETGIPWQFSFTTEVSAAEANGITASRRGARLDGASGYVQLVATGVHTKNAATAPGKPFYAVLSGRIVGVDFSK